MILRSQRLRLAGLQVDALSQGGIETSYQVPAFDVCLDIGRCPPGAVRMGTLLLTHGHIDHAAGLPYYISMRSMMGHPPPKVFVPAPALPAFRRILDGWRELQADTDRCQLSGLAAGDSIRLKGDAIARVYGSPHRIETLGYTLYSRIRKLKEELLGQSTEQIAVRARAGEEVHTWTERAELSFPGDTRIDVLESEPSVTTARVLLLECTFVGSSVSVAKAQRGGHIHLDQIAERASLFKNEVVLLTHFSRRHSLEDIRGEISRRFPPELQARIQLLVHER